MTDFWVHLGPWLIIAILVPPAIVFSLWIVPSDEWAERVIRGWAESEGFRLEAIDEGRWYDRLMISKLSVAYRVRVLDQEGRERTCKAVVGRFLLRQTRRNIAITWIMP